VRSLVEWKLATKIVGDIIREWDPYGLESLGAPQDEFDVEIAAVVKEIGRIRSADDVAIVLNRVFAGAFGADGFAREDCADVGAKLFEQLTDASLLEGG
jgi:hypothetical protein